MTDFLKKLCDIDGAPGYEDDVRAFITENVKNCADEIRTDAIGNLLVFKKGATRRTRPLMVCAHMDEVGFYISEINGDGTCRLAGRGMDPRVLIGRRMRVAGKIPGIISIKAIHLTTPAERKKAPALTQLYLDIGATSKAQAEKVVSVGDPVVPYSPFTEFGCDCVVSKALDDRIGCSIMLRLLQEDLPYDTWFVFSVCEEVAGTGAAVATRAIDPGICLNLEGTTAGDIPGVEMPHGSTEMRKGVAVSMADRTTVYPRDLREKMTEAATKEGIRWQYRVSANGGTDAGKISVGASGCKAFGLSNPTRYIHSACCVAYLPDIEEMFRFAKMFLREAGDCNV